VSWATPTVQANVATCAIGTQFHTWQLTAHGKTPLAHKGMLHAAKIMAGAAAALIAAPAALAAAKAAHAKALAQTPYVCPIPAGARPPLVERAA
jgi:aminobenzoyl-glutamate utilization protein B